MKTGRELLKALIITAVDTAMRKGEIIKLRWRDVDFQMRTITIIAFNSKTAKARQVGMTQRVFDELKNLWEISPKSLDELVFGIKDNFKKSFASACSDAKIEKFRFTQFISYSHNENDSSQEKTSQMEVLESFRSYPNDYICPLCQSKHTGYNAHCRQIGHVSRRSH